MNSVNLIGNLTREPELTETAGGVTLCRFTIAVGRHYSSADGERKTDFFNCIAWRSLGEAVARYAHKGNKVAVSGSIELRNFEDEGGAKRVSVTIAVREAEFLTPRQTERGEAVPADGAPVSQGFDDDDDIPF